MNTPVLYRKRLIPDECICLDKDRFLEVTEQYLITEWETIRPKENLKRGISAYFWDRGIKVSKFYDHNDQLICWYCDIITYTYQELSNSYIILDLLADVLIYPDGRIEVVDLDELAQASEDHLLSPEQTCLCLKQLNQLLKLAYSGEFRELQDILNRAEKRN